MATDDNTQSYESLIEQLFGNNFGGDLVLHGGYDPVIYAQRMSKYLEDNGITFDELTNEEGIIPEGPNRDLAVDFLNKVASGLFGDAGPDSIPDWNEWYAANGPDTSGDSDEDQGFADYVNEVGEGVANTAKGLYDELGDKITECVGSPLECIKQIGTAILDAGGIPPECQDMNDPFFCTENSPEEGGKACWKDCVSFNLPGLPIPNIPLPPGVVDIGTYRDFEDSIKTVGKTIGNIIEGNESCGPDEDQECTVGQVLEDVGTWAKKKWEEVFEGVDDATVDDVLDWLKGILGPVTSGIIWAQIEEEVTNVLASYDTSDDDFDCSTVGREQVAGATTADDCGGCTQTADDGTQYEIDPVTGACKDPTTTDPDLTEEEQDCSDKGRIYQNGVCLEECENRDYVVDPIDGKCGPDGDDDDDDDVDDDVIDDDIDCSQPVSVTPYATLVERQIAYNEKCVQELGWCPASPGDTPTKAEDHKEEDCTKPLKTVDGPTPEQGNCPEGMVECPSGQLGPTGNPCVSDESQCVDRTIDDTPEPPPEPPPEPYQCDGDPLTAAERNVCTEAGWTTCPNDRKYAGTWIKPGAALDRYCGPLILVGSPEPPPEEPPPPPGECFNGAIDFPNCGQCPDGQQMVNDMCVTTYTCPDPNATTNADGSCGPCKPGYVFDGSVEGCVQESVTDPCSDPAYAASNPGQCGSGPPEPPPAPPPEPPPEPPPPSVGGGGGGGMFSQPSMAVPPMGDPQLLARMEFPIVDYLSESLAKQTKDQLMTGMLTGSIV